MKCIICRQNKENMSDEHVIPDAIGGYYHIYNVCKDCNSYLGSRVDSHLIGHKLTVFQRFTDKLAGKTGKIPNPFPGEFGIDGSADKKVRVDVNKDGNLESYFLPVVRCTNEGEVLTKINIEVDPKDKGRIKQMLQKVASRAGVPMEALNYSEPVANKYNDARLAGKLTIDLHLFRIGLLKIAYEFAVDTVPEYFDTDDAIEISDVLLKEDHDRTLKFVNIGNAIDHKVLAPYGKFLDFSSNKHYLILLNVQDCGLVCFIKLKGTFSVGVVLSRRSINVPGEAVIGVNDIKGKSFKKYEGQDFVDAVYGRTGYNFLYSVDGPKEFVAFRRLELSPQFSLYKDDSGFQFFDSAGSLIGLSVDERVGDVSKKINTSQQDRLSATVMFDETERLYVKVLPSRKLVRVVGVEVLRKLKKKL